jgi:lysophospholipase L1-like esterase
MKRRWTAHGGMLFAFLAGVALASAATAAPKTQQRTDETTWVAAWEASPEPTRAPTPLANQTVRQLARLNLGGLWTRVQLSNEFGDQPLVIGGAHIAQATGAGAATAPGSDLPLTFGGKPGITIPPGARVLSDPVRANLPPFSLVAVSIYLPGPTGVVTEHNFSNQPVFLASGDVTAAPDLPGAPATTRNLVLSGIDVSARTGTEVVVTLGDSITGGFGSTAGANHDWPDLLAERLAQRKGGKSIGVVNAAIGGNRLLHDVIGPNALSRLDRDVLAQPGVRYLIVLLGINDFGYPGAHNLPAEEVSYEDVVAGYKQLIQRAQMHGVTVFIATLPPFGPIPQRPGYYSEASEAKRVAINQWIRGSKDFPGVIDFEAALRDPKAMNRMLPAYDSGDHLNPSDAGYKAMVDAIEMRLFE